VADPAEHLPCRDGTRVPNFDAARPSTPASTEAVRGSVKRLEFCLIFAAAALCFGDISGPTARRRSIALP
jgi:hypothetical protein